MKIGSILLAFILIANFNIPSSKEKNDLRIDLNSVRYWAYQIQGIEEEQAVEKLVKSRYDMLVVEPTRTDWSSDNKYFDTKEMVKKLKSSFANDGFHRKIVIAYLSIGEAEKWRWYWKWGNNFPDFIIGPDPDGWEDCYLVEYWRREWKDIIIYGVNYSEEGRDYNSSLEEIINDGFDGVYLDWVEAFENEDVIKRANLKGVNATLEMLKFMKEIKNYAKARNPDFIIIQQNGIELCEQSELFKIIDGFAQEAIWYDGVATDDWYDNDGYDIKNDEELTNHYLKYINIYRINEKPVFNCEYAFHYAKDAYEKSYENGLIPYCSRRSLSKLTTTPPFGYFNISLQKGFSFAGWWNDIYATPEASISLRNLRETGNEWISLIVTWYQENEHSTKIAPDKDATPSDESIIYAINFAHSLGMKVMLKPHIDLYNGEWRGEIEFYSDRDWRSWFRSYREFILHYADLAERNNVEQLCIGCELVKTVRRYEWLDIIEAVRESFSGPLTYASNWDEYSNVKFWDYLDFIGIDAYFPLTDKNNPSIDELMLAWDKWKGEIMMIEDAFGKPVVFTEIGYRSIDGCNIDPWNWWRAGEIDLQEQADCYEAAFSKFWYEKWFCGFYWWMWWPELRGGENDDSYTPYKKPAEKVLRKYYKNETFFVRIEKPGNAIYIFDREVIKADRTIIIGRITIEVNSSENIGEVEFYIDGEFRYLDNEKPYEWLWNELSVGKHEIKVIGNEAMDKKDVFIINLV